MTSLKTFSYDAIEHGGFVKAWLGHILYIFTVDPMDMEVVLKSCLEKDDLHRFMRKLIGYGGIFAPVSIWKRRRKVMVPSFSPKIVEKFVDVFSENSEALAKQLQTNSNGKTFDVWRCLTSYTLDSVCETVFGLRMKSQGNPDSKFLNSLALLLKIMCKRIFHLWLYPDWIFQLAPYAVEHDKGIAIIQDFTNQVIKDKREQLREEESNKAESDHGVDLGPPKMKTFLEMLITLSGKEQAYTDLELREEVLTLTVAGTDTSAVALGFTLMLLARYPEVQEKVYQELVDVFGSSDRVIVKEDLTKLTYLERVLKESLRLYPPVPFIIRKVEEEVNLPSGKTLPAGSGVVVSIWGAHRHPKYWGPDAEKFDPDRFLPERLKPSQPNAFLPFSSGPRNCLGYQYAIMSVKVGLASILRKYRVLGEADNVEVPPIRVQLDIMMKAVGGYNISLGKRKL